MDLNLAYCDLADASPLARFAGQLERLDLRLNPELDRGTVPSGLEAITKFPPHIILT